MSKPKAAPPPKELEDYEAHWRRVESIVAAVVASGERNLSRAVRLTEAEFRALTADPARGIAFGERVSLPKASLFGARRDAIMRVLLDSCRPETSMVVELGSGWGNNLLDLYLWGGPRVPYFALEPARSGRACVESLAELAPDLDLVALPFDFHAPVYELPRDNEHALVFTCMSIEQVAELGEEAITGLFDLAAAVTGVHFEPIGWQTDDGPAFAKSRKYALRRQYNANLWRPLTGLADRGEITIETVVPDMIAHKPENPSTLVVWTKT